MVTNEIRGLVTWYRFDLDSHVCVEHVTKFELRYHNHLVKRKLDMGILMLSDGSKFGSYDHRASD